MGAGAAMVKARHRTAVVRIAQHRPCREDLVERERAMEDVAAGKAEYALEVERTQGLVADNAVGKSGSVAVDGLDHEIGDAVTAIVPGDALRQLRRNMLAEQARHVRAFG